MKSALLELDWQNLNSLENISVLIPNRYFILDLTMNFVSQKKKKKKRDNEFYLAIGLKYNYIRI